MTDNFLKEEYGLKTDTVFKSVSATKEDLVLLVNRKEEEGQWTKVLLDAKRTSVTNFLVILIGDYGMGKTLSLFKINEIAKTNKLYAIRLNLKSEEKPTKPGLDFLQRIFKEVNFEDIKVTSKHISILKEVYPDVGNVFEKIVIQKQTTLGVKPHLDDIQKSALNFIRGEATLSQTLLKDWGVIRKINSVDIAKEYLIGLLYLIKSSGYPTLVISIDEFEYLFSIVTKSQQAIYLALLRELFDLKANIPDKLKDLTANMAFFIAISEDGWRRLEEMENVERETGGPIVPLKRRINAKITLSGLSKKDTKELIEIRLHYDRIEGKYKTKPLIPYTEDFVDYVFKLSAGRPADIIRRCDHVLDKGLEQRAPRLTAELAKAIFEERGLTY